MKKNNEKPNLAGDIGYNKYTADCAFLSVGATIVSLDAMFG